MVFATWFDDVCFNGLILLLLAIGSIQLFIKMLGIGDAVTDAGKRGAITFLGRWLK